MYLNWARMINLDEVDGDEINNRNSIRVVAKTYGAEAFVALARAIAEDEDDEDMDNEDDDDDDMDNEDDDDDDEDEDMSDDVTSVSSCDCNVPCEFTHYR